MPLGIGICLDGFRIHAEGPETFGSDVATSLHVRRRAQENISMFPVVMDCHNSQYKINAGGGGDNNNMLKQMEGREQGIGSR